MSSTESCVMMDESPKLTPKDFASSQQARWCPGCGDHSVWVQVRKVLADAGVRPERTVFVSGIGCSSRFPYYMNTYGFHTLHGRAPTVASGLKLARPDLDVWIVTGDGDALSIGGNHLIHVIRRNLDVNILLLNNRIYGLTKGQYSPTSEHGKRTKSSPAGTIEWPITPAALALGAGATFVARTVDMDVQHLGAMVERATKHRGTAFIEVYQSCPTFNTESHEAVTDKKARSENLVYLEHGRPLTFGGDPADLKGIRLRNYAPEVVRLADVPTDDLLVHDESVASPALAFMLSQMSNPDFPEPVGVLRAVERPTLDDETYQQIERETGRQGPGDMQAVLTGPESWQITG
ncbi:MAG: 2-oxoglutarate oxidoreductase subunit KorB [Phycisphaerae bacterium]|nr:2-oxoglutarate oxidoreductase subunit KorB [Phycisphaerae bacterium]